MSQVRKQILRRLVAGLVSSIGVLPTMGADMELEWSAVTEPDIAGYRLYYGTQLNSLTDTEEVGTVTTSTLPGLTGCTYYYVAAKARDYNGTVSAEFSNVIEGYPHPRIDAVTPASVTRGQVATVTIDGSSFVTGAVALLGNTAVVIDSHQIDSCGRMNLNLTIPRCAPRGWTSLTITNTDGGFGTRTQALEITDPAGGSGGCDALEVASATPGPNATNVDPKPSIEVQFSRPLDPVTATASRFLIRRLGSKKGGGKLAGAPVLDPSGTKVTLSLAAPLLAGQNYYILVRGGKKGVRSSDGTSMPIHYQSPPFKTKDLIEEITYGPSDEVSTSGLPLSGGSVVPAVSSFVVKFTEPLDPAFITSRRIFVKRVPKGIIPLVSLNPVLLPDGLSVLLTPSAPLPVQTSLDLYVLGGGKGIRTARGVMMAAHTSIRFSATLSNVASVGVSE